MKNNQNKKRTLIVSILSMALCLSLILGSTLAWFTSTVSNTENPIQAGQLGAALYQDKSDNATYTDAAGQKIFDENYVWEPNCTGIVYLQVKNIKDLALNYKVRMDIAAVENTPNTKPLVDALDYVVLPGVTKADFEAKKTAGTVTSWESLLTAYNATASDMPVDGTELALSGELDGKLAEKDQAGNYIADNFAIAVHMDKNASNEYQGGKINVTLTVDAWQMSSEIDIFGNQYDASAIYINPADVWGGMGSFQDASWDAKLVEMQGNGRWHDTKETTKDQNNPLLVLGEDYSIVEENGNRYVKIIKYDGLGIDKKECINLDPNATYDVVFKLRTKNLNADSTDEHVTVSVAGFNNNRNGDTGDSNVIKIGESSRDILKITEDLTEWTEYKISLREGAMSFYISIAGYWRTDVEVYIDDLQLIKTSATE